MNNCVVAPVASRPRLLRRALPQLKRRGRPPGSKGKANIAKENSAKYETKDIPVTRVFHEARSATTTTVCLRGGARSSKSYSVCNQLVTDRFFSCPGIQILVMRKTFPALRVSVYKQLVAYTKKLGLWPYIKENRQTMDWSYGNSLIHFSSLDDAEKIKSTEWNIIIMEEATEFTYQDYTVCKTRLSAPVFKNVINQIFLLFNPEDENHWIKTEVIDKEDDVTELVSSYKDNPTLSPAYIKILENLQRTDANHWRIYGLGEWGKLDALIFTNWRKIEESQIPLTGNVVYGLDFGFNNPSALVKCRIDSAEVYCQQKIYEAGLTNTQLIEKLKEAIPYKERAMYPIYADNAEPDRIEEINQAGFWCEPCYKGRVKDSIDHVKRYRLNITGDSDETLKEIRSYSWRKDRNERTLEEPVAFNDHSMACIRYAVYTHSMGLAQGLPDIKMLELNEDNNEDFDDDFPEDSRYAN